MQTIHIVLIEIKNTHFLIYTKSTLKPLLYDKTHFFAAT